MSLRKQMRQYQRCSRAYSHHQEFMSIIADIAEHPEVRRMADFSHHGDVNTYDHCMAVSYYTYLICKSRGFDYVSAARGAMLHDFFLYDWHECTGPKLEHTYNHPRIALANAEKYFDLNDVEREVILRHMYPAVPDRFNMPQHPETYCIALVDKVVCMVEVARMSHRVVERRLAHVAIGMEFAQGTLERPQPVLSTYRRLVNALSR